jgi:hypothetical protein
LESKPGSLFQSAEGLRGFCRFNPLRAYALRELARCAQDPGLRYGIKRHFGNSVVGLDNPEHVEREATRVPVQIAHLTDQAVTMTLQLTRRSGCS